MVRSKTAIVLAVLLILIWSCSDNGVLYNKTFNLPDSGWRAEQVLEGEWTPGMSLPKGSFVLDISHDSDFRYQNIYLTGKIEQNDRMIWSDTFFVQLAQPKSGRWLGRKKGNQYIQSYNLPIKVDSLPSEPIQYQFAQFSRDTMLKGVSEMEVKVIKRLKQ